ncbi:MAG TPA: GNAT family N-acetyltransferase [Ilumatobacteraceae bacterium]|nr:GNAT family N-acetyltransferase [Ilumatobacteraceae bacterium]
MGRDRWRRRGRRVRAQRALRGRRSGHRATRRADRRRDWRGRGVASALIARSMDGFEQAGFTHALLNVDSASPTGASRLYRSLGFEPIARTVVHQIAVR